MAALQEQVWFLNQDCKHIAQEKSQCSVAQKQVKLEEKTQGYKQKGNVDNSLKHK